MEAIYRPSLVTVQPGSVTAERDQMGERNVGIIPHERWAAFLYRGPSRRSSKQSCYPVATALGTDLLTLEYNWHVQQNSMGSKHRNRQVLLVVLLTLIAGWANSLVTSTASIAGLHFNYTTQSNIPAQPKPAPAPARWRGLIGEYGPDDNVLIVLEADGQLVALFKRTDSQSLNEVSKDVFMFPPNGSHAGQRVVFTRASLGRATQVEIGNQVIKRRQIEPESGNQLRIKPVRPVADLMKEALAAKPPNEPGDFRQSDLVELTKLDPTIRLEIRYATTNNFLGTKFYSQPRAFMQRPAAEAVVRVNRKLKPYGYGLLIHDAYRPWYVTKVFWDATPDDKKIFVADPAKGSRHNRGCAVDLTLYDLKTEEPVEMVSTYDETTARAYPDYPGGTSLQRWHRELLRKMMASEGFTVYEAEWWHFDYQDWQKYRIGNVRFEEIGSSSLGQQQPFGVRLPVTGGVRVAAGSWIRNP
jgi:D-alanyl-D-alanine dipeptidase